MEQKPDYDAMFRNSQASSFPKNVPVSTNPSFDGQFREGYAKKQKDKQPVTPEVLDSTGRPMRQPSRISGNMLGMVSVIMGVVAFVLVFIGMFAHFVMWLNIIICLAGVGFGVAALFMRQTAGRLFAAAGIALGIFDLLVQLICMIVVAVSSGVSAIFHLIT